MGVDQVSKHDHSSDVEGGLIHEWTAFFKTSPQTVPHNTNTTLTWQQQETAERLGPNITPDLDNDQMTLETAGLYLVDAQVRWPTGIGSGTGLWCRIQDAGGFVWSYTAMTTGKDDHNTVQVSDLLMNVDGKNEGVPTTIKIVVEQESGGDVDTADSNAHVYFKTAFLNAL